MIDLILAGIEPMRWDALGGVCTIHYWRGNLIVNAPDFVHRQIDGYRSLGK